MVALYGDCAANPAYRARILARLKSRLGRRPVEIALHRVYQNLSLENPENTLPAEYEAVLAADPGNSALIYLRGRLVSGLAASLGYFERAVHADPANAFAQAAQAYCRSSQGKWSDALAPAVRACELDPTNADFQKLLEDIQIALGHTGPLEKDLHERCSRSGWVPSISLVNLVNLIAVRGDREGVIKLCETVEKPRAGVDPKSRQALATELRCRAFYAAGDFAALAREIDKGEKTNTASHRLAVLLEQGRLDEAEALAQKEESDAFQILSRSIAWFLKGNAAKAAELRRKGAELLQKAGNRSSDAAAVLLVAGNPLDARVASDLDIPYFSKAIILTALAQAHPESAPELVRQARALNAGFSFPRHLLERALAGLDPKR
jgi:hypothetical protein